MPESPRPGSSSGSSSSCWPNRASTQAWNRVPNRAADDGAAASAGPGRGRTCRGRRAAAPARWPTGWTAAAPRMSGERSRRASSRSRRISSSHCWIWSSCRARPRPRRLARRPGGPHQRRGLQPAVHLGGAVRDRPGQVGRRGGVGAGGVLRRLARARRRAPPPGRHRLAGALEVRRRAEAGLEVRAPSTTRTPTAGAGRGSRRRTRAGAPRAPRAPWRPCPAR